MKTSQARSRLLAWLAGALLLILAAGTVWLTVRAETPSGNDTVALVNGEPITAAEFDQSLRRQRSAVMDYYRRTYGATVQTGFWRTAYNGETPADKAKEWALDEAVRKKVLLTLAEAHQLVPGASHEALLEEMRRENARRQAALEAGQPVYGPVRFDESNFTDFYVGKLRVELAERLAERDLEASEEQLLRHYEGIKENLFRLEDEINFTLITVSYADDGQRSDELKRQAEAAIRDIGDRLGKGEDVADIVRSHEANGIIANLTQEHMDGSTARYYYKSLPQLYEWLTTSEGAGTVGPIIDNVAEGGLALAYVTDRTAGGYRSYEEQRDNVRKHYLDMKLDVYLERLAVEAVVNVKEERLDRIGLH